MTITRSRALQTVAGALALPTFGEAARAADSSVVKLAVLPIEPSCEAYYADANGYFAKAGINAEISTVANGGAILQAMVSGTYDIGVSNITSLALAHTKGLPFVIVAPQGVIEKGNLQGGVFVAANSTIKGPRDLQGKTIAVPGLGTIPEYVPRGWVDKNGGDSTTIKFVELPFPTIADAITAGRVDAGWLAEPFMTIATRRGQVKLLTAGDDVPAPSYLVSAWCATASWAKAHADVVARFARTMSEAAAWANANPDKVVPIVASKLKLDPDLVAQLRRPNLTGKLIDAQIQPTIDMVAKYQKTPSFPVSELIFRA